MKKYVKPVLVFEDLNLTQHIAGTCEIIMNQGDYIACSGIREDLGLVVFATYACVEAGGEMVENDAEEGYCYYAFSNPTTTFIS